MLIGIGAFQVFSQNDRPPYVLRRVGVSGHVHGRMVRICVSFSTAEYSWFRLVVGFLGHGEFMMCWEPRKLALKS